jgi:hypothetical protein
MMCIGLTKIRIRARAWAAVRAAAEELLLVVVEVCVDVRALWRAREA